MTNITRRQFGKAAAAAAALSGVSLPKFAFGQKPTPSDLAYPPGFLWLIFYIIILEVVNYEQVAALKIA